MELTSFSIGEGARRPRYAICEILAYTMQEVDALDYML